MDLEKELAEIRQEITPIKTIKFISGTIVSCGAMAAIVAALKGPISSAKGITKLMMRFGVFILGCKAGDIAEEYFSSAIDKVIDMLNNVKEEVKDESGSDKQ